jgi:hypothetical protein
MLISKNQFSSSFKNVKQKKWRLIKESPFLITTDKQ